MLTDIWPLYKWMLKSRLFEEMTARLWHEGLISGELHLGTGEEAIVAGIVPQLQEGDAMALDHRGSAALLVRGVDPVLLLRELLGRQDGLCAGMGGHMHLFSKEHLAASSGIVGAAGPAAAGFALAAQVLNPGALAVAFFGEGATNQGMLMEAMNLASEWKLPVLFVCKDDQWAITTQADESIGDNLNARAVGMGMPYIEVDGRDVSEVWEATQIAMERARTGAGPTFLHAHCVHLEGHFLGYQLIRVVRNPVQEMPKIAFPLTKSFLQPGGGRFSERVAGLKQILAALLATLRDPRKDPGNDPVKRTRAQLQSQPDQLQQLEKEVELEINTILVEALSEEVLL